MSKISKRIIDEKASLIVEATIVIPLFFMFCVSFISLTSCVYAQARIQQAVNAAATEVSNYGYILNAMTANKSTVISEGLSRTYVNFMDFPNPAPNLYTAYQGDIGQISWSWRGTNRPFNAPDNKNINSTIYTKLDNTRNDDIKTSLILCASFNCTDGSISANRNASPTVARHFVENNLTGIPRSKWTAGKNVPQAVNSMLEGFGIIKASDSAGLGGDTAVGGIDYSESDLFYDGSNETSITRETPQPAKRPQQTLWKLTSEACMAEVEVDLTGVLGSLVGMQSQAKVAISEYLVNQHQAPNTWYPTHNPTDDYSWDSSWWEWSTPADYFNIWSTLAKELFNYNGATTVYIGERFTFAPTLSNSITCNTNPVKSEGVASNNDITNVLNSAVFNPNYDRTWYNKSVAKGGNYNDYWLAFTNGLNACKNSVLNKYFKDSWSQAKLDYTDVAGNSWLNYVQFTDGGQTAWAGQSPTRQLYACRDTAIGIYWGPEWDVMDSGHEGELCDEGITDLSNTYWTGVEKAYIAKTYRTMTCEVKPHWALQNTNMKLKVQRSKIVAKYSIRPLNYFGLKFSVKIKAQSIADSVLSPYQPRVVS
jgi:hypothetical protein